MTVRRPSWVRIALRAGVLLLAGAATALLVAVVGPMLLPTTASTSIGSAVVWRWRSAVGSLYWAQRDRIERDFERGAATLLARAKTLRFEPGLALGPEHPLSYSRVEVYESGWPAAMLWGWRSGTMHVTSHEMTVDRGLIRLPRLRADPSFADGSVDIPVLPQWPGMVANTLTFAAAWSLPLLPPLARRAIRRHRGLCTHCGYALAGIANGGPCPECGAPPSGAGRT